MPRPLGRPLSITPTRATVNKSSVPSLMLSACTQAAEKELRKRLSALGHTIEKIEFDANPLTGRCNGRGKLMLVRA